MVAQSSGQGPETPVASTGAAARFSASTASQIEPSKSAHIGSSSSIVVTGSGPGSARATAATITYPTLRFLRSIDDVRIPRETAATTTTGSSKTAATPSRTETTNER